MIWNSRSFGRGRDAMLSGRCISFGMGHWRFIGIGMRSYIKR
jgi:hypothetical protein